MTPQKKISYGIIEYYTPPRDEWQTNDVELDAFYQFGKFCHTASRLAILDMYFDLCLPLKMPFSQFILKLANEKQKDWSCPFTLVSEIPEITVELADVEIIDSLYDYPWIDDTFKNINQAFAILAKSHPKEFTR